jgi:itaconyl-CoA hydratase
MGFDLLSMRTRGLNADGAEITAGYRSGMLPDRASGIGPDHFPVTVNVRLDAGR